MKRLILIAVAAIAFASATQAQDSTVNRKMKMDHAGKMHRSEMMQELNLTADQQDKIKKLRDDNSTKMNDIKNNTSLTDDQKQEQMKSARKEYQKGVESLLTDEQKTKWKQMREEHMHDHNGMKAGADSTKQR